MLFRDVYLPNAVPGRLYLHSMPGRCERLEDVRQKVRELGIKRVIRLASLVEVENEAPEYARAIREGRLPWQDEAIEVPDLGIPSGKRAFLKKAKSVAETLRAGENVLVHCGAGIGRTGMFAICVLFALGMGKEEAENRVQQAGSKPETREQRCFIDWAWENRRIW